MTLHIVKVPRRPNWPWWAVAIVAAHFALVAAVSVVSSSVGSEPDLCLFHRLTSVPCPSCGATRGVKEILTGRILAGWGYNPLLFTVFSVFGAWLAVRLAFGRSVRLIASRNERKVLWALACAVFLGNWAYLIGHLR